MDIKRFEKAIQKVKNLEKYDEYLGAIIFGSLARGDVTEDSDLDVKVITRLDNECNNINHPFIDELKLDITFQSYNQLGELVQVEKREGRIPMIAESIILFDKEGSLQKLKDDLRNITPLPFTKKDYQNQQFFIYHIDEKVSRNLKKDPDSALLSMTMGLGELIKIHYKCSGKWRISSKRILKDLDTWDKPFSDLMRAFLQKRDITEKFQVWSKMVDHIVKPFGGRLPIEENICDCKNCKKDLRNLMS